MNDFLQTLRSSHADKQRTPMTRKSYDEAFYNAVPSYQQYPGRPASTYYPPNQVPQEDGEKNRLFDAVSLLSQSIETMAQNQRYLVDAQEKTADMLERQVIAMEKILDHLKISSK